MKLHVTAFHDPKTVLSMDYHPIQIMQPHLVLVLDHRDSFILAAGPMPNWRKVRPASGTWPCYNSIHFQHGLEPLQAQPSHDGERLVVNAAGLLKLAVIFDGDLSAFLVGNALSNAQRFADNVAAFIQHDLQPPGSMAQHTLAVLKDNPDILAMLKGYSDDAC
ncbi:hypothetical protein NM680_09995 [Paracoccus sp. PS-1]|uniref:hypothetical protein n=1 Tax=unclassified Paracoccus (in: a-proteobacteria) TaxID=2688777 RepID=UPI0012EC2A97|nr:MULTISPECIES: hypothetical protein [unclassified Paracoccus (in: a-proteobacteria)]MDQ7262125.1 hypothetical protein [Paracoccus sp. PS1]